MCNAMGKVDPQDGNGRSADGRASHQDRAVPLKMPLPPMTVGIEEPYNLTCPWVDARKVGAFVAVVDQRPVPFEVKAFLRDTRAFDFMMDNTLPMRP